MRAAEDICTPDHQKDADGNRIVLYAKDTLVTTITTGREWKSCSKGSAAWKILCSGNKGTGRICIKSGAGKGCINLSGSGYTDR